MNKSIRLLVLLSVVFVLTACATTHLVSTWQTKKTVEPLKKILVIGVSDKMTNRRLFEDIFSKNLEKAGVKARASYLDLPNSKAITRETVEALVKGSDYDAVLVTHYEGTNEQMVYQPGTTYGSYGYTNPNYWGHYNNVYSTVYSPGYYVNYKYVYLQTRIFSVKDGDVIWSARSETTNSNNIAKSIRELSEAVIKSLKSSGLIK